MVKHITFDDIFPIWRLCLWPNRISEIESHSAMTFDGSYDIENFNCSANYFCFMVDNEVAGVNSGHMCSDGSYRSRGLYVHPEFRKKGIGRALLLTTVEQARKEKASFVWSFPRQESWQVYESAGFELTSDWAPDEMGMNAYCRILL